MMSENPYHNLVLSRIIFHQMFAESKDEICIVLFGTDDTANDLAEEDDYAHITVARPVGMVDWDLLNYVNNDIQPGNSSADCIL